MKNDSGNYEDSFISLLNRISKKRYEQKYSQILINDPGKMARNIGYYFIFLFLTCSENHKEPLPSTVRKRAIKIKVTHELIQTISNSIVIQ